MSPERRGRFEERALPALFFVGFVVGVLLVAWVEVPS